MRVVYRAVFAVEIGNDEVSGFAYVALHLASGRLGISIFAKRQKFAVVALRARFMAEVLPRQAPVTHEIGADGLD